MADMHTSFAATGQQKRPLEDEISSVVDSRIDQSQTIIHTCLSNRMERLEDSLQILLQSYPDAVSTWCNGFLPIHLACIHFTKNVKVMQMIVRANPRGVMEPAKVRAHERERLVCLCSFHCEVRTTLLSRLNQNFCFPDDILKKTAKRSIQPSPKKKNSCFSRGISYSGSYPLHIALTNGASLDVVRLILNEDESLLMKKDRHGYSPLSIALKYKAKPQITNFLLAENRALSTVPDNRMNLPLHLACRLGCCVDVIETLLFSFPLAIHVKNRDGLNPLDLFQRSFECSDDVINLLQAVYHRENVKNIIDIDYDKKTPPTTRGKAA